MGVLDILKDTIGIDPGSQHLRVIKDGELVFSEQSQISIDTVSNVISGLGDSIGKSSRDVLIKPVNYVIADFQAFEMLLRGAIKKRLKPTSVLGLPKSYIMYYSLPTSSTEIEKRAYRDSAEHAGAVEVHMIHQSCCSAVGMNILFEKRNFILIDFSSSKIEITVFANSIIISEGVIRLGTWKIFRLLKNHVRRKYTIELSDKEVQDILTGLNKKETRDEIKIHYKTIKIKEIQDVLDNFFNLVNDEFIEAIERVSNHPNIENVIMNGVYFTGGGSLIEFLREQIKLDARIKRSLSQNPLLDNINGLKQIMADREKFRNYIMV
jgi:rod shape-determining protein MreB and related proteins